MPAKCPASSQEVAGHHIHGPAWKQAQRTGGPVQGHAAEGADSQGPEGRTAGLRPPLAVVSSEGRREEKQDGRKGRQAMCLGLGLKPRLLRGCPNHRRAARVDRQGRRWPGQHVAGGGGGCENDHCHHCRTAGFAYPGGMCYKTHLSSPPHLSSCQRTAASLSTSPNSHWAF